MTIYSCPECGTSDAITVSVTLDPNGAFPGSLADGETYGFSCGRCRIDYDETVRLDAFDDEVLE